MSRVSVLLAALLFGTTGTAQALGPMGTEPLAVGAARIAIGAVLLLAVASRLPVGGAPWSRPVLLVTGASIALYQAAFFTAVDDTGVAVGTVVTIGSGPAFAGLLGRVVNGEELTRRWALATALAAIGVAGLALGGGSASVSVPGLLLALVSGFGYATYTVTAKRLLEAGHPPEAVMARGFAVGAVLLLPVLVATGGGGLGSPGGIVLVLYLGAVPTALAYVLFARGLRRLSSGETATLTLAEPLTASVLGILVLSERLSVVTAGGGALVLAGLLVLAARNPRRGELARAAATVGAEQPATAATARSSP